MFLKRKDDLRVCARGLGSHDDDGRNVVGRGLVMMTVDEIRVTDFWAAVTW